MAGTRSAKDAVHSADITVCISFQPLERLVNPDLV